MKLKGCDAQNLLFKGRRPRLRVSGTLERGVPHDLSGCEKCEAISLRYLPPVDARRSLWSLDCADSLGVVEPEHVAGVRGEIRRTGIPLVGGLMRWDFLRPVSRDFHDKIDELGPLCEPGTDELSSFTIVVRFVGLLDREEEIPVLGNERDLPDMEGAVGVDLEEAEVVLGVLGVVHPVQSRLDLDLDLDLIVPSLIGQSQISLGKDVFPAVHGEAMQMVVKREHFNQSLARREFPHVAVFLDLDPFSLKREAQRHVSDPLHAAPPLL